MRMALCDAYSRSVGGHFGRRVFQSPPPCHRRQLASSPMQVLRLSKPKYLTIDVIAHRSSSEATPVAAAADVGAVRIGLSEYGVFICRHALVATQSGDAGVHLSMVGWRWDWENAAPKLHGWLWFAVIGTRPTMYVSTTRASKMSSCIH